MRFQMESVPRSSCEGNSSQQKWYGFLSPQPLGNILNSVDKVLRIAELDRPEFAGHSEEARDDVEGGMDQQDFGSRVSSSQARRD